MSSDLQQLYHAPLRPLVALLVKEKEDFLFWMNALMTSVSFFASNAPMLYIARIKKPVDTLMNLGRAHRVCFSRDREVFLLWMYATMTLVSFSASNALYSTCQNSVDTLTENLQTEKSANERKTVYSRLPISGISSAGIPPKRDVFWICFQIPSFSGIFRSLSGIFQNFGPVLQFI
jgi:hypothetical protein